MQIHMAIQRINRTYFIVDNIILLLLAYNVSTTIAFCII